MIKPGHYTDLLRQVNELKRQLHLVEAERKACDDEGNETIKANQQRLNRLKQDVTDLKLELADAARSQRGGHPLQSCHMGGILHVLKDNGIDITKYRSTSTSEQILKDLDNRIADLVKHADLAKYNINETYDRINEIDEQMALRRRASSPSDGLSSTGSAVVASPPLASKLPAISKSLATSTAAADETTLIEMQNVKQKMAEALHIQRQYRTILDVMSTDKISHERQLIELEKSITEAKSEAEKLKEVRESARRSRDAAKTELQHHEETLVASTRETDRLLSEYKRRIDEMKSSAGNPNTRRPAGGGGGGVSSKATPSQQHETSAVTSSAATGTDYARSPAMTASGSAASPGARTQHLGLSSAPPPPLSHSPMTPTAAAAAAAAAATPSDALADQDPAEQASLVDAKKAIDHLKSVTGASDIRSMIQIVESQREKCDELRQQFHVLQERQAYLTQLKETLQARYKQLKDAQSQQSTSTDRATPRLIDELFAAEEAGHLMQQITPKTGKLKVKDSARAFNGPSGVVTAADVFSFLIASVTKVCSQIPFGPPLDDVAPGSDGPLAGKMGTESAADSGAASPVNQSTLSATNAATVAAAVNQAQTGVSLVNQLDTLLTLLENKLSALMDLVKSLNAIKAEPATVANANDHDALFGAANQVAMMSGPSDSGRLVPGVQVADRMAPVAAAAAAVGRPTGAGAAAGQGKMGARVDSASDEDQVPTRGYLKRQTRIIVEAKTKKQTQRPRKGD